MISGPIDRLVTEHKPFGNKFRGGVRVAAGDINGDGTDDVVAAQGSKGGKVRVFAGTSETAVQEIKIGSSKYKGGVSVAAADLDGDGNADIIAGRAFSKPTQIEVISGLTAQPIGSSILPLDPGTRKASALPRPMLTSTESRTTLAVPAEKAAR